MSKFRIMPHGRLHEWVAEEKGFFKDEGLDYEFVTDSTMVSRGGYASVQTTEGGAPQVVKGAFEQMEQGSACDVNSACHWAVNMASAGQHGRMWGHAYSVCPSGIFVAADSPYLQPEDLAGVPVAVGFHSGSHYSAIQGLEPFVRRGDIALSFSGRPYDHVRLLMRGEVPAANVFGAQYYLLEQQGYRKLVDTTFVMGFLVPESADLTDAERYFRAMERAQRDIDLEPERYKKYWLREMPDDLAEVVDVRRFGPGERIVFQPYTREMFDATQRWMRSWDLLDVDVPADMGFDEAVLT